MELINLNGSIIQMLTCCHCCCCCHHCHFRNVVFRAFALNVPLVFISGGKRSGIYIYICIYATIPIYIYIYKIAVVTEIILSSNCPNMNCQYLEQ